jgi:SAM-dependent methyltransferase
MRLALLDVTDVMFRRRDPLVPSRRAIEYVGGSDFAAVGQHLADVAINIGGLQRLDHVLDVGCGYGRLAVPLTRYLEDGTYDGFDISRRAIRWCRTHITARFANFRFTHADVRNGHYNPKGHIAAIRYVFPYPESSVDLVIAASVFTHLMAEEARHYISESSRVLKRGGRCVASFYILDSGSVEKIRTVRTEPEFHFVDESTAVQRTEDPEAAIALSEQVVREMFVDAGLQVSAIHRGSWRQRAGASYQDFVLATKP